MYFRCLCVAFRCVNVFIHQWVEDYMQRYKNKHRQVHLAVYYPSQTTLAMWQCDTYYLEKLWMKQAWKIAFFWFNINNTHRWQVYCLQLSFSLWCTRTVHANVNYIYRPREQVGKGVTDRLCVCVSVCVCFRTLTFEQIGLFTSYLVC